MAIISVIWCLPGPPSTAPSRGSFSKDPGSWGQPQTSGPEAPISENFPGRGERCWERSADSHRGKTGALGWGQGGPISRKASGRTPGRKGLEVSGRAAWTGWSQQPRASRAGQLPCLSEPGIRSTSWHMQRWGREGRRLLLSRPQAGGHEQQEERSRQSHLSPGDVAEGARVRDPWAENPLLCRQEPRGPTRQVHTSETAPLCLSQTPPRPASMAEHQEGTRGAPIYRGHAHTEGHP